MSDDGGTGAGPSPDGPGTGAGRAPAGSAPGELIEAVPLRRPGRWIAAVIIVILAFLFIYGAATNKNYEWNTYGMAERPRVASRLGENIALIMRHHGALTVGRSVAQAFITAKDLVEACRIQLLAESGGMQALEIDPAICASTVQQFRRHDEGRGTADWPAYLRELAQSAPHYRS